MVRVNFISPRGRLGPHAEINYVFPWDIIEGCTKSISGNKDDCITENWKTTYNSDISITLKKSHTKYPFLKTAIFTWLNTRKSMQTKCHHWRKFLNSQGFNQKIFQWKIEVRSFFFVTFIIIFILLILLESKCMACLYFKIVIKKIDFPLIV